MVMRNQLMGIAPSALPAGTAAPTAVPTATTPRAQRADALSAPPAINPAPVPKPPTEQPAAGNTGFVPPSGFPSMAPAGRDVALRALATQPAPAAPAPAASPAAPAGAPPPGEQMRGGDRGFGELARDVRQPGGMEALQSFIGTHPDVAAFAQQFRSADPASRQQLLTDFHDQIAQWQQQLTDALGSLGLGGRREAHMQANNPPDNSEYERSWDGFSRNDGDGNDAESAQEDMGEGAQQQQEATRIKRIRQRRLGGGTGSGAGIYTGTGSVG